MVVGCCAASGVIHVLDVVGSTEGGAGADVGPPDALGIASIFDSCCFETHHCEDVISGFWCAVPDRSLTGFCRGRSTNGSAGSSGGLGRGGNDRHSTGGGEPGDGVASGRKYSVGNSGAQSFLRAISEKTSIKEGITTG
jgi:hypothetical protein